MGDIPDFQSLDHLGIFYGLILERNPTPRKRERPFIGAFPQKSRGFDWFQAWLQGGAHQCHQYSSGLYCSLGFLLLASLANGLPLSCMARFQKPSYQSEKGPPFSQIRPSVFPPFPLCAEDETYYHWQPWVTCP